MLSVLNSLWVVFRHMFRRRVTIQYPEQKPYLPPRWRGRIILSRDPDGGERCVACYLCAVVCPVDCIALQATEDEHGRRFPEFFRINFSRCIYCGLCEDACPTYAIQLTPDFEMSEYTRPNLVYEKEDLLIDGAGKYPGYNYLPGRRRGHWREGQRRGGARSAAGGRADRVAVGPPWSPTFYAAAVVAIVATALAISQKNVVHALLYLIVSLLAVALMFLRARRALRRGARSHHLRGRDHGALRLRHDAAQSRTADRRAGAPLAAAARVDRPARADARAPRRADRRARLGSGPMTSGLMGDPRQVGIVLVRPLRPRRRARVDAAAGGPHRCLSPRTAGTGEELRAMAAVPMTHGLIVAGAPVQPRAARRAGAPQHHLHPDVDRSDAERGRPGLRRGRRAVGPGRRAGHVPVHPDDGRRRGRRRPRARRSSSTTAFGTLDADAACDAARLTCSICCGSFPRCRSPVSSSSSCRAHGCGAPAVAIVGVGLDRHLRGDRLPDRRTLLELSPPTHVSSRRRCGPGFGSATSRRRSPSASTRCRWS